MTRIATRQRNGRKVPAWHEANPKRASVTMADWMNRERKLPVWRRIFGG